MYANSGAVSGWGNGRLRAIAMLTSHNRQAICQECCAPLIECGGKMANRQRKKKMAPSRKLLPAGSITEEIVCESGLGGFSADELGDRLGIENFVLTNSLHYWY